MSAVLMLAAISATGGLLLGFYCVTWPCIVIPSLIIAIVTVLVSLYQNFSFLAGIAFCFGCLSLHQITYVIAAAIIVLSEDPKASLTGNDQTDGFPAESYQGHNAKQLCKHAPSAEGRSQEWLSRNSSQQSLN